MIKHKLTPEQLSTLEAIPANREYFVTCINTLWRMLLGDAVYEAACEYSIDPTQHGIPREQSKHILSLISARSPIDIRVPACMQYVNVGPSSYDESELN